MRLNIYIFLISRGLNFRVSVFGVCVFRVLSSSLLDQRNSDKLKKINISLLSLLLPMNFAQHEFNFFCFEGSEV